MIKSVIKKWELLLGILIFLSIMYNFINEARKEKLLRNTKFVKGVLESEDHSSLKFNDGVFIYNVNSKKYKIREKGNFSFLHIGDTVIIEYSILDPSISKIKNRNYMQKYKKLKR